MHGVVVPFSIENVNMHMWRLRGETFKKVRQ